MIVEKLSHLTKKAEQESTETYAHQNPCKFSNVVISTISESKIIDT